MKDYYAALPLYSYYKLDLKKTTFVCSCARILRGTLCWTCATPACAVGGHRDHTAGTT